MAPTRTDRLWPDRPEDQRGPFQRDRDRLVYCSALRRLAGVTQVVSAGEGHLFHNRLTHTLKVAQISRRLVEKLVREQPTKEAALGGIDPEVAEAAALAHDLGHPPFGHIAEKELDRLAVAAGAPDGYEGNAQSFRIVSRLATRHFDHDGLNLTRATLNGILKYPWRREASGSRHKKWGAYHSERKEFEWARELYDFGDTRKSAEAALMDWADDIAYSVHDVEDFYRAAVVPLDRLVVDPDERGRFLDSAFRRWRSEDLGVDESETYTKIAGELAETAGIFINEQYHGTKRQRAGLRSFTSLLVSRYIYAARLNSSAGLTGDRVLVNDRERKEVRLLKELVWHYVINNPALATQQHGQKKVISTLFSVYLDAVSGDRAIFPARSREELEEVERRLSGTDLKAAQVRVVADLIAGMTESQAIRLHDRFTAGAFGSITDAIHL